MNVAPALRPILAFGLCPLLFSSMSAAGDGEKGWPQWRGPDGDGISKETGWTLEGSKLWETNVGMGYSTVSVANGRLYTMGHEQEWQEDAVFCLDAETGEEIWVHPFPSKTWNRAHKGGTLSTPSIDGDVVYVSNREGNLFCLDAATGEVRWHSQVQEEHELPYPTWGFAAAPYVLDDMIVMNLGVVLAFDKKGELLWKTERNYGHSYSTPAVLDLDGQPCLAVFSSEGLVVLTRKEGKELGFHGWALQNRVNAATPVVVGKRVFISSGMNKGCAMLEMGKEGLEVVWENKAMRNSQSGCVLYEDHLYGFDQGVSLKCLDLDGEEKWSQRGLGQGCMLLADGKILALSDKGELVIAKATPAGYEELARTPVLKGGVYWTTPVLLDGLIYCRNSNGDLVCLDHRPKTN